jgi:hypothetical protein
MRHSSRRHGIKTSGDSLEGDSCCITSLNSSRGVNHTDSLNGTSDEEILSALADQFVSRAYRLIGKTDNKRCLCVPSFWHSQCPLCLRTSISGMAGFRFAHMFPTPCGATDVRSLDTLSRGVLTLCAAIEVRAGTVRSDVPTHPGAHADRPLYSLACGCCYGISVTLAVLLCAGMRTSPLFRLCNATGVLAVRLFFPLLTVYTRKQP